MKRTYLALLLLTFSVQSEFLANTCQVKPVFISLGSWCAPAFIMRNFGLRHAAFPFDWNTSTFEDFYKILQDDFKNFMLKENLIYSPSYPTVIYDKGSKISFHHDFPIIAPGLNYAIVPNFLDFYETIKAKYDRRIKRFKDTLQSSNPVIFIRADAAGNRSQTLMLRDLFETQYPHLNFLIIQLGCTEEYRQAWNLDRILNFYIDKKALDPINYNAPDIINVIKAIEKLTGCTVEEFKALNTKPGKEE